MKTMTLSEMLRGKREELHIPLSKISGDTKVHERFLQHMEAGRWDRFPSAFHLKYYLRTYLSYLGLDDSLLEAHAAELFPGKETNPEEKRERRETREKRVRRQVGIASALFLVFAVIIIVSFVLLPSGP